MKKQLFSLFILVNLAFMACSQNNYSTWNGKKWEQIDGSGKLVTLDPPVDIFNAVEVNNVNVNVETGAENYSLHISVDDNLKDYFKWKVENGILKLFFDLSGGKYSRWISSSNTVVTIKAPAFEKLVNHGNSNVSVNLKGQSSFILLSDGNPDIEVTGKTGELVLQSSGNADINAGSLVADKIILTSNGNADIEVNTKELVEKSILGNNDITNRYYTSTAKVASENYSDYIEATLISIKLKNTSLLPVKITLISYRPDERGNGTTGFMLLPLGSKTVRFPVGTKLYLADREQVNTVMSGAKISDQAPFLVLKKDDDGKSFTIK